MEEIKEADKIREELDEIMKEHNPEKIENLFTKATKVTSNFKNVVVQGGRQGNSKENLWIRFIESTSSQDKLNKFYKSLVQTNNKFERNIKIYIEKKFIYANRGYTDTEINTILTIKYDLGKRQINRIIEKIDKKMKKN